MIPLPNHVGERGADGGTGYRHDHNFPFAIVLKLKYGVVEKIDAATNDAQESFPPCILPGVDHDDEPRH